MDALARTQARPRASRKARIVIAAAMVLSAIVGALLNEATHKPEIAAAIQKQRAAAALMGYRLMDRARARIIALTGYDFQDRVSLKDPLRVAFPMLGPIDLYQRNGLVEIYGAALRQHKTGPITVGRSVVHVTHDRALVFWTPDDGRVPDATHLEITFNEQGAAGFIGVGITTTSGATYLFAARVGPEQPAAEPRPLAPLVPEELAASLGNARLFNRLSRQSGRLVGRLPRPLRAEIADASNAKPVIKTIFLLFDRAAGSSIELHRVALVRPPGEPATADPISIAGRISGGKVAPGTPVTLLDERGRAWTAQVGLDQQFVFDDVPAHEPVSLRLHHVKRDYHASFGRWFVADHTRYDLNVDIGPAYVNLDGHQADATKAKFVAPRKPSEVGAFYEPHARQVWPGSGMVQEYDSTTFTNNHGFIDRDRFFDNPDGCFRIVHLGSSIAVALQVRPFEKYNIVMESELALRMQRCVEVISAGRDNGDIGSNYPRVRDYAVKFRPDAIVIENSSSLVTQLHPELLKRGFGWDHEFNALDNFFYDTGGKLEFRAWSPEYPLHTVKPDFPELTKGVAFFRTLHVPLPDMHAWGVEAFKYLTDIVGYFRTRHPEQRFIVHTALDQAQCRDACNTTVKLPDGKTIPLGADTFAANHQAICEESGIECIRPHETTGYNTPETYLTFIRDGHYSVRGHQWLARELSGALASSSKANSRE
jgi:hypothetical protein